MVKHRRVTERFLVWDWRKNAGPNWSNTPCNRTVFSMGLSQQSETGDGPSDRVTERFIVLFCGVAGRARDARRCQTRRERGSGRVGPGRVGSQIPTDPITEPLRGNQNQHQFLFIDQNQDQTFTL